MAAPRDDKNLYHSMFDDTEFDIDSPIRRRSAQRRLVDEQQILTPSPIRRRSLRHPFLDEDSFAAPSPRPRGIVQHWFLRDNSFANEGVEDEGLSREEYYQKLKSDNHVAIEEPNDPNQANYRELLARHENEVGLALSPGQVYPRFFDTYLWYVIRDMRNVYAAALTDPARDHVAEDVTTTTATNLAEDRQRRLNETVKSYSLTQFIVDVWGRLEGNVTFDLLFHREREIMSNHIWHTQASHAAATYEAISDILSTKARLWLGAKIYHRFLWELAGRGGTDTIWGNAVFIQKSVQDPLFPSDLNVVDYGRESINRIAHVITETVMSWTIAKAGLAGDFFSFLERYALQKNHVTVTVADGKCLVFYPHYAHLANIAINHNNVCKLRMDYDACINPQVIVGLVSLSMVTGEYDIQRGEVNQNTLQPARIQGVFAKQIIDYLLRERLYHNMVNSVLYTDKMVRENAYDHNDCLPSTVPDYAIYPLLFAWRKRLQTYGRHVPDDIHPWHYKSQYAIYTTPIRQIALNVYLEQNQGAGGHGEDETELRGHLSRQRILLAQLDIVIDKL